MKPLIRPLVLALFLASGAAFAQAPSTELVTPPAALHIEGIPPVTQALARRVAAYTEFRGHAFSDWHPTRAEMLVSHRDAGASTAQLFRLDTALGTLTPVTQ